jgi:hypothetical protein
VAAGEGGDPLQSVSHRPVLGHVERDRAALRMLLEDQSRHGIGIVEKLVDGLEEERAVRARAQSGEPHPGHPGESGHRGDEGAWFDGFAFHEGSLLHRERGPHPERHLPPAGQLHRAGVHDPRAVSGELEHGVPRNVGKDPGRRDQARIRGHDPGNVGVESSQRSASKPRGERGRQSYPLPPGQGGDLLLPAASLLESATITTHPAAPGAGPIRDGPDLSRIEQVVESVGSTLAPVKGWPALRSRASGAMERRAADPLPAVRSMSVSRRLGRSVMRDAGEAGRWCDPSPATATPRSPAA